jgi:hypothetical protein
VTNRDPSRGSAADGPVFIGGASRSGKTLVRWLLSSHPSFAISRRTELWPRFYGRFGDLAEQRNGARCLAAIMARPQVVTLGVDEERLSRAFEEGPATYPRLFALIHEEYAKGVGKPRWGDQSEGLERFADAIFSALPDARFLHLVRDPRDRYVAIQDKTSGRGPALGRSTAAWISSLKLARRNLRRHPSRYRTIRYEDLVRDPEGTMRETCAFLGAPFVPDMLLLADARRYDVDRANAADGVPVSTAHVGIYRDRLSALDLAVIQASARDEMAWLGYETAHVGRDKGRAPVIGLPLGLSKIGAARALGAVRDGTRRRGVRVMA